MINQTTENRINKKRVLPAVMLLCSLCFLCGCTANPKNFSLSGLTITLTDDFEVGKANAFDIYIKSEDVIFTAVEETTSELEKGGYEISSLADYADEIIKLNNAGSSSLKSRNNYKYFVTHRTVSGARYSYVHCIFKNSDSYWVCEFACKAKNFDRLEDKILSWADTIKFD